MKEETKCYCGHTTKCYCGPKTIEEFAEKNVVYLKTKEYISLMEGVKWQQERSYSEEEVKNLTELFLSYYFKTDKGFDDSFDEWFEQFKNK